MFLDKWFVVGQRVRVSGEKEGAGGLICVEARLAIWSGQVTQPSANCVTFRPHPGVMAS